MSEVTVQQIVGINIKNLREAQKPRMRQADLADAMEKEYGVVWARQGMYRLENGHRQVDANELMALADLFDVPVWYFFTPPAELATSTVVVGDRKKPAWTILTDLLKPEKASHHLAYRAYTIAVDLERLVGNDNDAFKGITKALANNNFPQLGG